MKRNKYYIIILTIFFFITSCKKSFLEVPVSKQVVAEDYVTNLSRAEEFLNGTFFITATEFYTYTTTVYADIIADNIKPLSSSSGRLFPMYSWQQEPDEEANGTINMNAYWRRGYNTIRYCNFLLQRIDDFRNENPTKADAIKGQLYALRALTHFNLANIFAQPYNFTPDASHPGIPYDTIYEQSQHIVRQSVREIYDHAIDDLNMAIQLIPISLTGIMPSNITAQSWISKYAAKALLARILLFKGDFVNAKSLASEVSAAVPIMPRADYPSKLFTVNDKESLFWFPPAQNSSGSSVAFQGYYFSMTNYFAATSDLVDLIKQRPADSRNKWFATMTGNNWQIKKFPMGVVAGITISGLAYYHPVIRSSEMYLTVSEASAKTGDESTARFYLDAIRQRADNSVAPSTATGAALLDSIYSERRKELCFENLRMYDLLRLGKGVNRSDVVSPSPAILPYPSNKAIAPIPLIDVQYFSLPQNPNY